jgi:hypothetical protein
LICNRGYSFHLPRVFRYEGIEDSNCPVSSIGANWQKMVGSRKQDTFLVERRIHCLMLAPEDDTVELEPDVVQLVGFPSREAAMESKAHFGLSNDVDMAFEPVSWMGVGLLNENTIANEHTGTLFCEPWDGETGENVSQMPWVNGEDILVEVVISRECHS